jgi:hypothetical protein
VLHYIVDASPCCIILAFPDENTPFTTLINYLNSLHISTIEILWIVLDRINGPIWNIFQVYSSEYSSRRD